MVIFNYTVRSYSSLSFSSSSFTIVYDNSLLVTILDVGQHDALFLSSSSFTNITILYRSTCSSFPYRYDGTIIVFLLSW